MSQSPPWTDKAIVSAIAAGGTGRDAALQWWFGNEGLQRWVRQYAMQHGGSEADGEDLYHDSFITFDRLLREGKYREEASLKTFFAVLQNGNGSTGKESKGEWYQWTKANGLK